MTNGKQSGMDEIDRIIMGILAEDPRTPYSEIAHQLEEEGFQMSSEGIRYRVRNLFEVTSPFFMINPEEHDWHVIRLWLEIEEGDRSKDEVFETLDKMNFWFLSRGFGTIGLYAVGTAPSTKYIEDVLDRVRGLDGIKEVNYFVETKRSIDVKKYLPINDTG